jgi:hypothetical protein
MSDRDRNTADIAPMMERLETERDAASFAADRAFRWVAESRLAKQRADAALAELQNYFDRGMLIRETRGDFNESGIQDVERVPDEARIEAARTAARAAADRLLRAQQAQEEASTRFGNAERLFEACKRYVTRHGPFTTAAAKAASPKRGEKVTDAVDRVRDEITAAAAQAATVAGAPPAADEIRQRVRAQIAGIASRSSAMIVGPQGVHQWPTALIGVHPVPDAFAIIAMLFPDKLAALAEGMMTGVEGGITSRDRAARLKELAETALALNRDEETLIREAESQGLSIARRGDADPRAVLGVSGPAPTG